MLKTRLCDFLGIDVPIIQAPMGAGTTNAALAAAVSNAGGLGGFGSLFRTTDDIKRDIDQIRSLTNRHFAVNHIPPTLDREAFQYTLAARPPVVSFTLGDPGDLVREAQEVGARVIVQITTVRQAMEAAERGADVIIAQGSEAGGYSGDVSTMTLVPQVVDAVSPVPVVASGGIYDGRGIAAALMLGAVGVNIGTRFLASSEAPTDESYRQAIAEAKSEDAVKVDVFNDIKVLPGRGGYGTVLRALRSPFIDEWSGKREEAADLGERLWDEIQSRVRAGLRRETLVTAGQTVGGIRGTLSVAEIMRNLVAETNAALGTAPGKSRN
ncbi:MAG: NAD(P)H-dependent flavin oxidoreductase [Acetobacteraceae bacterium]